MKTIKFIALAMLVCIACDTDDDFRDLPFDKVELRTPGEHLDFAAGPPDQILCCSNPGGCVEPSADGSCPGETVATCCADDLTCNPEACWYECGPQYCPPNA